MRAHCHIDLKYFLLLAVAAISHDITMSRNTENLQLQLHVLATRVLKWKRIKAILLLTYIIDVHTCHVPCATPLPDKPRSATENEVTNVCTKMLNPWPNNLVSFNYYNENVN